MLSNRKLRIACAILLGVGLLMGVASVRLTAQGTTGSILGTVSDSSGGVLPEAVVHVRNTGTNATVSVTSDAQGRYRVPDLPVGEYEIQTEKAGFQTVIHSAVTLNAGANIVVDFPLPVGQVTQTVTVESDVSQVETTSSALSSVIEPTQMRDLPLNGRNFEELILLAPGVVEENNNQAAHNSYIGFSKYWSVSGTRANGQGELLDGTNVQDYQERGSGSGILGTTLGVDAISEFQVLTNTYGAQYGGNGSVVNAVTRSGTNTLHGSAYEFIRNSAMDATQIGQTVKQPFRKNQFGGTLGGPIVKDKMFYFVNYEGIRQDTGTTNSRVVPDANAMLGILPTSAAPAAAICPVIPGTTNSNCGPGSPNAANFAAIKPFLNLWTPFTNLTLGPSGNLGNGTQQVNVSANSPANENYVMGRYDWTISNNDSLFVRDLFDNANLIEPFYGNFPQWGNTDRTRNQFLTIGEKHVLSAALVNSLTVSATRTFLFLDSPGSTDDILDWSGKLTPVGVPAMDGTLGIGSGVSTVGPGQIGPVRYAQNKFSFGDDIFWTKGDHSLRFGGGVTRIQTNGLHMFPGGGSWTFSNISNFFQNIPNSFQGPCYYTNPQFAGGEPGCTFPNGQPLPTPNAVHGARETDFNVYIQDDWKVRPTLTLNVGFRYEPRTNPTDSTNQLYQLLPVPYPAPANLPPALGSSVPSGLTPMTNFFLKNDSLHTFDPRIGLAWDPFKDHKTSVRAGFGIFHSIVTFRDYRNSAFSLLPWLIKTVSSGLGSGAGSSFPVPFQNASVFTAAATTEANGTYPYNTTPYLQQWNLSIQREIMRNTVLTVAYVGSRGVHLLNQGDANPVVPTGALTQSGVGGILLSQNQVLWPVLSGQNFVATTGTVTANANALSPTGTTYTCTSAAGCTLAAPNGQPFVNPATGQVSGQHIVQSNAAGTFSLQTNTHLNPNFGAMNNMISDAWSSYNGLQVGFVRRMTNNLSLQASYSYSRCFDLTSGDWTQEGGTIVSNPYNINADKGPCLFDITHNFTTNTLYQLPFKANRLVSGWQIGGVLYLATGAPFSVGSFTSFDNAASRVNFVPNAPGCNNAPINAKPVTGTGVFFLNQNCFTEPAVGELGTMGRDLLHGPGNAVVNMTLQKVTKVSERFTVQFRAEGFNVFNRENFSNPGGSIQVGSSGSFASLQTGSYLPTFGQVTSGGTMRQLQLGLKVIF